MYLAEGNIKDSILGTKELLHKIVVYKTDTDIDIDIPA